MRPRLETTFFSLFISILLTLFSPFLAANEHYSPLNSWQTIESAHFRVNYQQNDTAFAKRTTLVAESLFTELAAFFNHQPADKIELIVSDQQDRANGYASPFPFNRVVIYKAQPKGLGELNTSNDWLYTLLKHELTHTFHLDKAKDFPAILRSIFGRNLFSFPHIFQPDFMKEGLATYIETDWEKSVGRGQSAYYDMVLRSEVNHQLLPLSKLQQRNRDQPFNQSYSYGVAFHQFLDETQGKDSIPAMISQFSGQALPFQVDAPYRFNTQYRSLEQAWIAFESWLAKRYETDIAARTKDGLSPVKQLSADQLLSGAPYSDQEGNVFYSAVEAYRPHALYQRRLSGEIVELIRTRGSVTIAGKVNDRLWYFQEGQCDHMSTSFDLYELNLTNSESKRISRCQHYRDGDVKIDERGRPLFVLLKQASGLDRIVQFDLNSQQETNITVSVNGAQLASPRWLADTKQAIYAKKTYESRWHIVAKDLRSNAERTILRANDANFFSVRPNHDSTALYFDSDKNKSIEIWQSQPNGANLQQVTHSMGGASSAFPSYTRDTLTYRYYDHRGWSIAQTPIPVSDKTRKQSSAPGKPGSGYRSAVTPLEDGFSSPSSSPLPSPLPSPKPYSAFNTIAPRSWFFGFASDDAHTTANIILEGRDTLNFHNWALSVGNDFENDLPVFQGSYTLFNHLNFSIDRYYEYQTGDANAPSGFADKAITQERYTEYSGTLFHQHPFEFSTVGLYLGMNVNDQEFTALTSDSLFFDKRVETFGFGLSYYSAVTPFLAIGPAIGRSIKATLEHDSIDGTVFRSGSASTLKSTGKVWSLEWLEFLQLYQAHRLELRALAAYADRGADYFDLAGSAPTSLFTDSLFHHRERKLRGYPDSSPDLISRKPVILSADYEFPLLRLDRGITGWPLGMYDLTGTLFHEIAKTGTHPDHFDATGFELNLGLDIGYGLLPLQITTGVAIPHQETLANQQKDANLYLRLGLGL